MASITARNRVHVNQENPTRGKAGLMVKETTAAPLTRTALGTVTNQKLPSTTIGAKRVSKLSKPGKASTKLKPVPSKDCEKHGENEAMDMGTPAKVSSFERHLNVFDLSGKADVKDIDQSDSDDPQLCSQFVNDIYQYMLYLEASYPIKKHYLKETALKSRMRSILVDWLIQVHHRFGLLQETLYLTVAVLDRFLQLKPVPRTKLQLAGVTAMLLASKYEEMYAPEVNDFVYITDQAFTRSQIFQMEILILKTLDFNLGRPLPLHFLRRNSKAGQVDARQHTLAKYLMELSMVDYEMCHVPPSKIAAGALCLANKLIDDDEWSPTLEHYSRYSYKDLHPVICHLAKNLNAAESSSYRAAVKTKYASHKAFKISQIDEVKSSLVSQLTEEASSISL